MQKTYITSEQLLRDSFELAKLIVASNYRPTFLLGVWRGGAPIAIAVHEVLMACEIPCDHDIVRVSSYKGVDSRNNNIEIHNIDYLTQVLTSNDRVLIIDDVHDTGLSIQALVTKIKTSTPALQIKIAVPYYKPSKSKVDFEPDFYVAKNDGWLVFPHELVGLNEAELQQQKPEIGCLRNLLTRLKI